MTKPKQPAAKLIDVSGWQGPEQDEFLTKLKNDYSPYFQRSAYDIALDAESVRRAAAQFNQAAEAWQEILRGVRSWPPKELDVLSIFRQTDTTWYWDEAAKRYRDQDGRFLSRAVALQMAWESIDATNASTEILAQYVADGVLSITDWKNSFRQTIKDEYVRQYLSAIGGRERMTQSDWGVIGRALQDQYAFLDGFENAVPGMSEAAIRARMQMYVNSANYMNERAYAKLAKEWGVDEGFWDVDELAENCDTCLRRGALGWVPVGERGLYFDPDLGIETVPGKGDSECLTNCRCSVSYRNSETGEIFS